jgi:hypothetical protein
MNDRSRPFSRFLGQKMQAAMEYYSNPPPLDVNEWITHDGVSFVPK